MYLPTIEASIEFTDQPVGNACFTDICARRNCDEVSGYATGEAGS